MAELGDFMEIRRRLQVEDLLNRGIVAAMAANSRYRLTAWLKELPTGSALYRAVDG